VAIDSPIDQALSQIEAERRDTNPAIERFVSTRPFLRFAAAAVGAFARGSLAELVSTIHDFTDALSKDRSEYLLGVVVTEIRDLTERFESLERSHQEYLDRDWPGLLLDAERKARETRTRQKIERIGKIAGNAARSPEPLDKTEELMRIAMALDDSDVQVLAELVRGQRVGFDPELGGVPGELVNNYWRSGSATPDAGPSLRPKRPGRISAVANRLDIPEGELQATCAKLQAYGLVVQVERNNVKVGLGAVPYSVLARGFEFIDSIKSLGEPDQTRSE
jgi:hypothetical protein